MCGTSSGWTRACACNTQSTPAKDGGREQMEVKVKCECERDDIIEKMLSCIQEMRGQKTPSLLAPFLSHSAEMYSVGCLLVPTRLVNGTGVEYFKLHFPPFSLSLSLFPPLFGCALVKCTHDPVSAAAVHTFYPYDIMLYFWD